jgi:hypothetical protein
VWSRANRVLAAAFVAALLLAACGGSGGGGNTSTTTTTIPSASTGSCAIPAVTDSVTTRSLSAVTKDASTGDRNTRRGRVYQELWKHEAADQSRTRTRTITPQAVVEDIGQIAVVRDEGDIILAANAFDLRSLSVTFARTGVGGFDLRPSSRSFQSSVGTRITLGDDDTSSVSLPFTVPFYSGRFTSLFVNSDGNITFNASDTASTDRDVSRFLTGPPRIALLFNDLDPSAAGGVFRRIDSDAVTVTWCDVPEFGNSANRVNVQVRIGADGNVDFIYGAPVAVTSAVVGVSPGATGIFRTVDVSQAATAPTTGGTGAVGERFAASQEVDFVALGRRFYQTHGDDFDQFVIFSNVRTTASGTFAFEFTVANEVTGIGVDVFDSARDFGSGGRLRSIVNMDAISKYPEDPRTKFLGENNTLSILGQECGHRWLAYLEFRDGASNSTELLGRDQSHWSFFFDSDASNMEGNDISDLGGGAFRTVGAVSQFSPLDQYAMGLRTAAEVPLMFLVRDATGSSADSAPRIGVDLRGTRKDVRIEDVVAAMGPRVPSAATAQKNFREAFIYIVRGSETSDELAKLERIRTAWETYFSDSVGRRGSMSTRLR